MGHYLLWVIGEDAEGQLRTFNEGVEEFDNVYKEKLEEYHTRPILAIVVGGSLHKSLHRPDDFWVPLSTEEITENKLKIGGHRILSSGLDVATRGDTLVKRVLPEGSSEIIVTPDKLYTFAEYLSDYYDLSEEGDSRGNHFVTKNGEVTEVWIRRSNQAKWDWCKIGGKYNHSLLVKNTEDQILIHTSLCEPGVKYTWPNFKFRTSKDFLFWVRDDGYFRRVKASTLKAEDIILCDSQQYQIYDVMPFGVDHAIKSEVDFDRMILSCIKKAEERYDEVHNVIAPYIDKPFKPLFNCTDESEYLEQLLMKEFKTIAPLESVEEYLVSEEKFVGKRRYGFLPPAVLKHGKWHERSNMKPQRDWEDTVWRLLQETPDDELITVVDCRL